MWLLTTCLLLVISGLPPELAKGPDNATLGREQFEQLEKGKVLVHLTEIESSKVKKAVGVGLIQARPTNVFSVLIDYEKHTEFMPYVAECIVHERNGAHARVEYNLDLPWPIQNRYYTLNLNDRQEEIGGLPVYVSSWTYLENSGNIKDTHGSWIIAPYGSDASIVRYTVVSDPGGKLPGFANNMATKSSVPKVIRGLRKQVTGSRTHPD